MRHVKEVTVPAYTTTVVESHTCDLCGKKLETQRFSWEHVTVECNEELVFLGINAEVSPEPTYRKTSVDMCKACFKNKLIPWLLENGAKIQEEDCY